MQGDTTVCRRSLPTAAGGRFLNVSGRPMPYQASDADPRLARPFPWEELYGKMNPVLMPMWNLAAVVLCLVTVVVPEILVRWAARRQRRGLSLLLILPVIAAIILVSYRLWATSVIAMGSEIPFIFFVVTIAIGFTAVVFVRHLWTCATRRRWWSLGVVLAVFALFMIRLPIFVYLGLRPSEHIEWNQWHLLLFDPVYNTGALIIAWKLLRALVRGLWGGGRGLAAWFFPKGGVRLAREPVIP